MSDYFYSLQMAIIRSPYWEELDLGLCLDALPAMEMLINEDNQ